ncbi:hypothetical protein MPSEU_000565700 [Mayamaea pseudoterrestris]|nr:hypothetical protein MPSEU_000565700 [Mayamaea pseudoterrestris]
MSTIKGYLPVRVKFQSFINQNEEDETFFYVKEHQQKEQGSTTVKNDTLFITNAPTIPRIRTRLLLTALLGRFGEIKQVSIVENPMKVAADQVDEATAERLHSWTKQFEPPTFLAPSLMEGSFAHVVFTSNKEMKRTLKDLQQMMNEKTGKGGLPGVTLNSIDLQTLRDASDQLPLSEDEYDACRQQEEPIKLHSKRNSGFVNVIDRYRHLCRGLARDNLLGECNLVMELFEDAEEQARKTRASATSTVDEDGFVSVSYSAQVGSKQELEQDVNAGTGGLERRRKGQGRNRKKKQGAGATELSDFYRFQTKVNRKRTVQELRERFEEDLVKLKRMKDEKQFRPF